MQMSRFVIIFTANMWLPFLKTFLISFITNVLTELQLKEINTNLYQLYMVLQNTHVEYCCKAMLGNHCLPCKVKKFSDHTKTELGYQILKFLSFCFILSLLPSAPFLYQYLHTVVYKNCICIRTLQWKKSLTVALFSGHYNFLNLPRNDDS